MPAWQDLVSDKKQRQLAAIPKEWIIKPPLDDQLDVTGVPSSCGLLSPFELEVTETDDVGVLLAKLAAVLPILFPRFVVTTSSSPLPSLSQRSSQSFLRKVDGVLSFCPSSLFVLLLFAHFKRVFK